MTAEDSKADEQSAAVGGQELVWNWGVELTADEFREHCAVGTYCVDGDTLKTYVKTASGAWKEAIFEFDIKLVGG